MGIGAGGKLNNFEIFRMNPERQFFSFTGEEEQKIKKLSGLFQYPNVSFVKIKDYISEKAFDKLHNLFIQLQKEGFMDVYEDHIELKGDGVFWGNNIGREVIKISLEEE